MRLVQPAAIDSHHPLPPRRVEPLPLQPLYRFAAHFPVQVAGTGTRFEAGERRLMCGPSGKDHEAAAAGGSRGIEWNRLSGATNDHGNGDATLELELLFEEQWSLRVRLGRRIADELERFVG